MDKGAVFIVKCLQAFCIVVAAEIVDIGAEQANGHTDGQKQRIAPNAPLHEKQG